MRQAVESNLDTIHDRLPERLRPAYRWSQQLRRWTPGAAAAVVIVSVLGFANARTPRTDAGTAHGGPPSIAQASAALSDFASPHTPGTSPGASGPPGVAAGTPVLAVSSKPFEPDVLHLAVRRVVIDAGHGGDSRGTAGEDGALEKTFTLDIAERMRTEVEARGFSTVMTRTDDKTVSLQRRADLANSGSGDVFVSIHINWFEVAGMSGIETYYLGPSDSSELDTIAERENQHAGYSMADLRTMLDRIFADTRRDESRRLATTVQQALITQMRAAGATAVDRGVKRAPFVVLVATEMPAILAEVSCLSNKDEAERLSQPDYRQRIAEALATGVETFARARG